MQSKLPEIIVFAGPNGSGKSTITRMAKVIEPYINADDIKKTNYCSDLEAAILAESMREAAITKRESFTFETVLSTERNLNLLKKAKERGYFIRCIYVLTTDVNINIFRVESRTAIGGHSVPEDKIRSRYEKALKLIPELVEVCDIVHIYDNTNVPTRIFKKRKNEEFIWGNEKWSEERIKHLVGK
ncbi:MAG: zeta toxin family protein [Lachnospiraceae bacterium]|nr:zeta toxin family protein [Lachnospiraceae bacterium]